MSLNIDKLSAGQKVKFLDTNGTDYQIELYRKTGLKKDAVYTIFSFEVHDWDTEIWLEEFEGCIAFNSVCFVEAE